MKKYVIVPFIISILAHGIFFGVFRGTLPVQAVLTAPKLYIIPSGQIKHEMARDITLAPLSSRLSGKNPIWTDTLFLSEGIPRAFTKVRGEESILLPLERTRILRKLPLTVEWRMFSKKEDVLPRFGDLFYYRLPSEIVRGEVEHVISLSNNIKFVYYIEGPVSGRDLQQVGDLPLEVESIPVKLRLRFWVANNGRVNQVIIEEGSGFPIIDKKVVAAIKEWRFSPVYIPRTPIYQWGVMKIRIQG